MKPTEEEESGVMTFVNRSTTVISIQLSWQLSHISNTTALCSYLFALSPDQASMRYENNMLGLV